MVVNGGENVDASVSLVDYRGKMLKIVVVVSFIVLLKLLWGLPFMASILICFRIEF